MLRDNNYIYLENNHNNKGKEVKKYRHSKGNEELTLIKENIDKIESYIIFLNKMLNSKDEIKKEIVLNRINKLQIQLELLKQKQNDKKFSQLPSHKYLKQTIKKKSREKIKTEILQIIETSRNNGNIYLCKEDVAIELKVKIKYVEQIFMELNIEGILSKPKHLPMHDSSRDPGCYFNNSAWSSDIYTIINK